MPTITAGQSSTFTIPAGQVAQVTGNGTAILLSPLSSPISIVNSGTIGPFNVDRIVSFSAVSSVDYTVAAPSTGPGGGISSVTLTGDATGSGAGTVAVKINGSFSKNAVKTTGQIRIFGMQSHIALPTPGGAAGFRCKIGVPAGMKRFRLAFHNKSTVIESRNWRVSIAPTAKSVYDTAANAYGAWSDATTNNNVVASDTVPNGWRQLKFDGNVNSPVVPVANQSLPGFGYNVQTPIVWSDWIEVGAIPCIDSPTTKGEFYYVLAFERDTTTEDGASYVAATAVTATLGYFTGSAGNDMPLMIGGGSSLTLPVTNPAATPAGLATNYFPYVTLECDFGIKTTTVWACGDSETEGYRWPYFAVNRKSTAAAPWTVMNLGASTTRTESFLSVLRTHLAAMNKPDYVLLPSISINNYSPATDFKMPQAYFEIKRLFEMVNYLNSLGIKVIIWTNYNYIGVNGSLTLDKTKTTPVGYVNQTVREFCATGAAILMDLTSDARWNQTLYNASTNPTGAIDPDSTHPSTPYGIEVMAALLGETIAAL